MRPFTQILGIAHVEFKFVLRRGVPILGMVAVAGMVSLLTFWQFTNPQNIPEGGEAWISSLAAVWPVAVLMTPLVMTTASIISVPSDREAGIQPILFSQPIRGATYLAGKTLGLLGGVLLTWLVCLVIHWLAYRVFVGPFNLGFDLALLLVSGVPLVTWVVGMAVLAGAWVSTRRAAILVGAALGLVNLIAWLALFPQISGWIPHFWDVSNQALDLVVMVSSLSPILSRSGLMGSIRPFTVQDALFSLGFAYLTLTFWAGLTCWRLWARDNL